MLDRNPTQLTELGVMSIRDGAIMISGFRATDATCRDVAALAIVWAIGELQVELMKTLERPGANNACVD